MRRDGGTFLSVRVRSNKLAACSVFPVRHHHPGYKSRSDVTNKSLLFITPLIIPRAIDETPINLSFPWTLSFTVFVDILFNILPVFHKLITGYFSPHIYNYVYPLPWLINVTRVFILYSQPSPNFCPWVCSAQLEIKNNSVCFSQFLFEALSFSYLTEISQLHMS